MTLWNEAYFTPYLTRFFPVFLNTYFPRGWVSQERDFSKPVFSNLLRFGMCVLKWFVADVIEAFGFTIEIVRESRFLLLKCYEK